MDFERSEVNLRKDMAAKNEYLMQKYKDYTRFIGNSSKDYREKNKGKEKEEVEVENEGLYVKYLHFYCAFKNY